MSFSRALEQNGKSREKAVYFLFSRNNILIPEGSLGELVVLNGHQIETLGILELYYLGDYNGQPCYCGRAESDCDIKYFEWVSVRSFFLAASTEIWSAAGYARMIHDWNTNTVYCGRCGEQNNCKEDERAKICPECGLITYPRISPAIMAAVVREDKLLLARGKDFPNPQMFSILAGFVEPFETLEDCLKREVYEETGIRVKNIKYFKSQPWPFPDSLMIGFTAQYESGEIQIDKTEIAEAGWFDKEKLPQIPGKYSLSGEMIRNFIAG